MLQIRMFCFSLTIVFIAKNGIVRTSVVAQKFCFVISEMIEIQIREIPEDFFVDIVAEQNFLVQTFQVSMSGCQ